MASITLQVQDVLLDAMGLINATEIDETPSSSEMAVALRTANVMIGRWSSQRLLLRSETELTFTCTGGKHTYSVGTAGTNDIVVPSKVLNLRSAYITDASIDHGMDVITKTQYDSMEDKNVSTARPLYIAYDPGAAQQSSQSGNFYLYYTPDKNYPMTLEVEYYLNELGNFTDSVTFEPVYYEALIYNLAVRLFRRYHASNVPVPPDLAAIASNAITNLKTMNSVKILAGLDVPGKVSKWNIYTDGV